MKHHRLVSCEGKVNIAEINKEFTLLKFKDRQKGREYLKVEYGLSKILVVEV